MQLSCVAAVEAEKEEASSVVAAVRARLDKLLSAQELERAQEEARAA